MMEGGCKMKNFKEGLDYVKEEIISVKGKVPEYISGISVDSRNVKENYVFFAMPGQKEDGKKYIKSAIENGAICIIFSGELSEDYFVDNISYVQVRDIQKVLGRLSAWFNDFPSQKLTIIGVTGTNGKTTVTHLLYHYWKTKGEKAGLIGTIYNKLDEETLSTNFTTPQPPELQSLLKKMVEKGIKYVSMEISSHALALRRTEDLYIDGAVFTNLTQDHLDFHHTMEEYFSAKKKIFNLLKRDGFGVLNKDDDWIKQVFINNKTIWCSLYDKADLYVSHWENREEGLKLLISTPKGDLDLNLKLRGKFNVYNILLATGVLIGLDEDLENIKYAWESFNGVPGRLEFVDEGQNFSVIIDYAHTPDGLYNILSTVSEFTKGRKILVFGCGGDRDPFKRPKMGEIAGKLADYVIITSDNPRNEDPYKIIREIEEGIKGSGFKDYVVIENRELAIKHAIEVAKQGDSVIIAGKGHEDYQIIGSEKIHFSDKEVAQKYLRERKSHEAKS